MSEKIKQALRSEKTGLREAPHPSLMSLDTILEGLNAQQRDAVMAPAEGRLQIIAGPGTGKTKVLVCRVAYLLIAAKIPPQNIIVTTFTKKAANEMVERLEPILQGQVDISKLLIGTFHSICYRIVRRYGDKLGLNKFTIADERDSSQILQEVMQNLTPQELKLLEELPEDQTVPYKNGPTKYHEYDPKVFKKQISKLKSGGITVVKYQKTDGLNRLLLFIYQKYQNKLEKEFLLDFDDCLLQCHLLISKYPVLSFVQHVLVDEFQDTNEIQLQLMYNFAMKNNLTIVGDPDQSIYAFRSAQSANFSYMKRHYSNLQLPCSEIMLNENYRSTNDVLDISETIMKQQALRLAKRLKSQQTHSFKPVHKTLDSNKQEARWIAYQILFLKLLPRDIFKYQDVAILVRSAFQTRVIEQELISCKIPYKMVRGKAFWERKEVTAIIDYLRVASNPNDRLAYLRTLSFPKKGAGDKTIDDINNYLDTCDFRQASVHQHLQKLTSKKVILNHLLLIQELQNEVEQLDQLDDKTSALEEFFSKVYETSGLKKEFAEDEEKDANVMEVMRQLMEFEPVQGEMDGVELDGDNHISKFITSIGLYETEEQDNNTDKVALSTIHGSKGLEWPVVFVPGLSFGLFPSRYVDPEDEEVMNEERRCFYVATTRCKILLYLSSIIDKEETRSWIPQLTRVSPFMTDTVLKRCHDNQTCFNSWENLKHLYRIMNVVVPEKHQLDLDGYNKSYEFQWDNFDHGTIKSIDPFNYREPTLASCFTTAKNLAPNIHLYSQVMAARKKLKKPNKSITSLLKTSNKGFKPPVINKGSGSKAPKYEYKPIKPTGNNNRAPTYIIRK